MNRTLRFFDYEQCYKHYVKSIESIRQKRIGGETIVAKPVLLVALIDGIEAGVFMNNRFVMGDWLEGRYLLLMKKYTRNSQFVGTTGIEKPFWHLESDGFWHLHYPGETLGKGVTPSKAWLKGKVEYASLDEPLWILLQDSVWRQRLRGYIVENKLTDDFRSRAKVAVSLGIIAALIVAA